MPVAAFEQMLQRGAGPVALGDRRDVAVKLAGIARFIHQAREQRKAVPPRAVLAGIEITVFAQRGAVGDDHPHSVLERAAQAQGVAELLGVAAVHRALLAGVHQQRQVMPGERGIEVVAQWRAGVDALRGGQPFDGTRAAGRTAVEFGDGIGAIGVDRRRPLEVAWVPTRHFHRVVVGRDE